MSSSRVVERSVRVLFAATIVIAFASVPFAANAQSSEEVRPPRWLPLTTPDEIELHFEPVSPNEDDGAESEIPTYRIRVEGDFEAPEFRLWQSSLEFAPRLIAPLDDKSKLQIGDDGYLQVLVDGKVSPLEYQTESAFPGQRFTFCLESVGRSPNVFSSLVPIPLVVRDERGHEVEVQALTRYKFYVIAQGFDQVSTIEFVGDQGAFGVIDRQYVDAKEPLGFHITDEEDTSPLLVYWSAETSTGTGTATLNVRYSSFELERVDKLKIEVQWGGFFDWRWATPEPSDAKERMLARIRKIAERLDTEVSKEQLSSIVTKLHELESPGIVSSLGVICKELELKFSTAYDQLFGYPDSIRIFNDIYAEVMESRMAKEDR